MQILPAVCLGNIRTMNIRSLPILGILRAPVRAAIAGTALLLLLSGCGDPKGRPQGASSDSSSSKSAPADADISGSYEFMTFRAGFEQEAKIAREHQISLTYTNGMLELHSRNLATNGTSSAHVDGFRAHCQFKSKKPDGDEVWEVQYVPGYGRFLTNKAGDAILVSKMILSERKALPFLYLDNYAGQWNGREWKQSNLRIWDVISKKDSKGYDHTLKFDMRWKKKELSAAQRKELEAGNWGDKDNKAGGKGGVANNSVRGAEEFAKSRLTTAGFKNFHAFDSYGQNGNRYRFAGWGEARGGIRNFDIVVSSENGRWEVMAIDIKLR